MLAEPPTKKEFRRSIIPDIFYRESLLKKKVWALKRSLLKTCGDDNEEIFKS
jgi:hypothetical protein